MTPGGGGGENSCSFSDEGAALMLKLYKRPLRVPVKVFRVVVPFKKKLNVDSWF